MLQTILIIFVGLCLFAGFSLLAGEILRRLGLRRKRTPEEERAIDEYYRQNSNNFRF